MVEPAQSSPSRPGLGLFTGTGAIWKRQSFVGLSDVKLGTLTFGRHRTASATSTPRRAKPSTGGASRVVFSDTKISSAGHDAGIRSYEFNEVALLTPFVSVSAGFTQTRLDPVKWNKVAGVVNYLLSKRTNVHASATHVKASDGMKVTLLTVPASPNERQTIFRDSVMTIFRAVVVQNTSVKPPISGIHHLKFPVANLSRSTVYYADVFGAERITAFDYVRPDGILFAVLLDVPGLGTLLEIASRPFDRGRACRLRSDDLRRRHPGGPRSLGGASPVSWSTLLTGAGWGLGWLLAF